MKRERLGDKPKGGGAYFEPARSVDLVSSGCTLLDCCLGGGWAERVVNLVGDKSTGKTLLACEMAANYLLKYPRAKVWYREVEAAFDEDYVAALGIPVKRFNMSKDCSTVEDVFEELGRIIRRGNQHGMYIIDSLDALSDRAELARTMDEGSYAMDKAKKMGQLFRRLIRDLGSSRIMLVVVSQVRDKIGVRFGDHYTRTGGKALDFYASQVVFLSQTKVLKRGIKKVERPVGIQVHAKVKKNKVGPQFRECEFPILFGFGVEDVVAGVEFLTGVNALGEAGIDAADARRWSSLRDVARMDKKEYDVCRQQVSRGVKKVWRRIESDFAPVRLKY